VIHAYASNPDLLFAMSLAAILVAGAWLIWRSK